MSKEKKALEAELGNKMDELADLEDSESTSDSSSSDSSGSGYETEDSNSMVSGEEVSNGRSGPGKGRKTVKFGRDGGRRDSENDSRKGSRNGSKNGSTARSNNENHDFRLRKPFFIQFHALSLENHLPKKRFLSQAAKQATSNASQKMSKPDSTENTLRALIQCTPKTTEKHYPPFRSTWKPLVDSDGEV